MLKEICVTPQVFDSEHIDSSNWKDIKTLLEAIKNSGYILGLNNKDWLKTVRKNLNSLDSTDSNKQKIKDRLNAIFDLLQNRNRICGHPKGNIIPGNENDWIKIAKDLNDIRPFYALIATAHFFENIHSVDDLEDIDISDKFGVIGSQHYIKSEDALQQLFLPILSYARKLTVIDPYFYIDEPRYQTTLSFLAKFFKERRGQKDKGNITINCKWNPEWDSGIKSKFKKWQNEINKIFQEYGHIVTVNVWAKKPDGIKMHERYIITDQVGIVAGAGTDKDDFQQSEWSIKNYDTLDEIKSQYIENASVFELKCIVMASKIESR